MSKKIIRTYLILYYKCIDKHTYNITVIEVESIKYQSNKCIHVNVNIPCSYCRTIFTNIPRYNYVDPDFSYTNSEKLKKKAHEDCYARYIKDLRSARLQRKAEM